VAGAVVVAVAVAVAVLVLVVGVVVDELVVWLAAEVLDPESPPPEKIATTAAPAPPATSAVTSTISVIRALALTTQR